MLWCLAVDSSLRRAIRPLTWPGWFALAGAGALRLISLVSGADFLLSWPTSRVTKVISFLSSPVGLLLTLTGGLLWIGWAAMAPAGRGSSAVASDEAVGAVPTGPTPIASDSKTPPLVTADCGFVTLEPSCSSYFMHEPYLDAIISVPIRKVLDPKYTLPVSEELRAAVMFASPSGRGRRDYVVPGVWLGKADADAVTFNMYDVETLVVAGLGEGQLWGLRYCPRQSCCGSIVGGAGSDFRVSDA